MREIRTSGSEGGVESYISIPTPIYREPQNHAVFLFVFQRRGAAVDWMRRSESRPAFGTGSPCKAAPLKDKKNKSGGVCSYQQSFSLRSLHCEA